MYKNCFQLNAEIVQQKWIPNSVGPKSRQMFSQWERTEKVDKLKYSQPTEWNQPPNADDCYFFRKAVEKGEQEDVDEYMNVLETLSIESEPEDCNVEEKITEDDKE
ncbi:hypothetical protein TKK_0001676 [Trichogramma kaykai]